MALPFFLMILDFSFVNFHDLFCKVEFVPVDLCIFSKKKSEIQSNKASLRIAWDIYDPIKIMKERKQKIKVERLLKMKL